MGSERVESCKARKERRDKSHTYPSGFHVPYNCAYVDSAGSSAYAGAKHQALLESSRVILTIRDVQALISQW